MGILARRLEIGANANMTSVVTRYASPAVGHYSQAIVHNGTVYVSGLLPITASGDKLGAESFDVQARQVMMNLKAILIAAGSSLSHALSVRVYFADISKLGAFNAVYSDFMGPSKPARAVVPVPDMLPFGSQLEVEAIAAMPSIPRSRL